MERLVDMRYLLLQGGNALADDVALRETASKTMLRAIARAFAAAPKTVDDLPMEVLYVAIAIDAQARIGVMNRKGCPSSIERPLSDFVLLGRLVEVFVLAGLDEAVVAGNGFCKHLAAHLRLLPRGGVDLFCEFFKRIGREEEVGSQVFSLTRMRSRFMAAASKIAH